MPPRVTPLFPGRKATRTPPCLCTAVTSCCGGLPSIKACPTGALDPTLGPASVQVGKCFSFREKYGPSDVYSLASHSLVVMTESPQLVFYYIVLGYHPECGGPLLDTCSAWSQRVIYGGVRAVPVQLTIWGADVRGVGDVTEKTGRLSWTVTGAVILYPFSTVYPLLCCLCNSGYHLSSQTLLVNEIPICSICGCDRRGQWVGMLISRGRSNIACTRCRR